MSRGAHGRATGGWDDDNLDPDKPYHTTKRQVEPSAQDKAKATRFSTWNPAAALFGGGGAVKKELRWSQTARGGSISGGAPSPPRSPARSTMAAGSRGSNSPMPRPPVVSSPSPSAPSVSPNLRMNNKETLGRSSGGDQDPIDKVRYRGAETYQEADPKDVMEALGEIKRLSNEVKELQTAVTDLNKSHKSLQAELRKGQPSTTGSLPIDDRVRPEGKQAGKPALKGPASVPEITGKDAAMTTSMEPVLPQNTLPTPAMVPPVAGVMREDSDFLGALWDTCGFHTKALPPAPVPAATISAGPPPAPVADSSSAHLPLPPPAAPPPEFGEQVGGSASSVPTTHNAASYRETSPHNRETVMDGRGNNIGSGRRSAGTTVAVSPTGSRQSPRQNANEFVLASSTPLERQHSEDSGLPGFGLRKTPSSTKAVAFQDSGPLAPLQTQAPIGLDSSHASSALKQWRSPQVGQKLELPFPELELEDEESAASSSPGIGTAASSPGVWPTQVAGNHRTPSPVARVPSLNLSGPPFSKEPVQSSVASHSGGP